MVVLAVTWMAKVGHESEVAGLFAKLTEESRKEPGCAMYVVHRHKTEPRRFFIYEQYKDDAALEAHRAAPHFLQFARKELPKIADRVEGHLFEPLGEATGESRLVNNQHTAGRIAFLRHFHERHDDGFAAGASLLHHDIRDALRELAFLVGRAALEHRYLN